MKTYLGNFLGGAEQVATLAVVAVLWLGLAALGGLAVGRNSEREAWPLYGWGIASLLFTVAGVLTPVPFSVLAWALFIAGSGAAVFVYRRDGALLPAGFGLMLALAAPLFLLAAAMLASQWDEFSHWLPAVRHLLDTDAFPSSRNPVTTPLSYPAYPFNWPLLTYLASRLAGQFLEGPGRLFNLLLLMSYGLMAARLATEAAGHAGIRRGWAFAGLALAAATLLNPAFVQKVVLTAYADVATAVLTAAVAYLGFRLLAALAEGAEPRRLAWSFALASVVLLNTKQVNLVLFVLLVVGTGLAAWRDPQVGAMRFARLLPILTGLPLAAYLLWRYHVSVNLGTAGAEFGFMPFGQWNFPVLHKTFLTMLDYAVKKAGHFGVMLVAVGFALRALRRVDGELDRLAILVAVPFLGYNAFLVLTYLGSFGPKEAAGAISFWRYNMHVALLTGLFGAYGAGLLWRRFVEGRALPRWVFFAPGIAVVSLSLLLAPKFRFDHEPPKPRYNQAALFIAREVPRDRPLHVVNAGLNMEPEVFTRARANRRPGPVLIHYENPADLKEFLAAIKPGHLILVHAAPPPVAAALGLAIAPDTSYLAWRRPDDGIEALLSWSEDGSLHRLSTREPWKD
ncbi:MAG: hypothetical protein H7841_13410 [Magnetospirillum sp. WYHS-4]